VGDWTKRLMSLTLAERQNPTIWMNGPHPSPFMESSDFTKLVLIASGAGITPAISVIENYHSRREVHLIFVTSEVNMIKFFLKNLAKVSARIFFTGSKEEYAQLEAFMQSVTNVYKIITRDLPIKTPKSPSAAAKSPQEPVYGRAHAMTVVFAAEVPEIDYLENEKLLSSLEENPESLITKNQIQLIHGRPDISNEINERIHSKSPDSELATGISQLKNSNMHELANMQYLSRASVLLETASVSVKHTNSAVLYCGASVPLRKAVESACDQLQVQFYSEYFGEW
jgi:hypothetical protein